MGHEIVDLEKCPKCERWSIAPSDCTCLALPCAAVPAAPSGAEECSACLMASVMDTNACPKHREEAGNDYSI